MGRLLLLLYCWCCSGAALAFCNALTPQTINFGAQPSPLVRSSQQAGNSSVLIDCSRILNVALISGDVYHYQVTASTNAFRLRSGSFYIPYQLSSHANFTVVLSAVGQGYNNLSFTLLNIIGGQDVQVPLYARTLPANVAAGTYTDQLTLLFTGRYCRVAVAMVCIGYEDLNSSVNLQLSLKVERSCALNVPAAHHFGTVTTLSQPTDFRLQLQVDCTLSESYQLHIDNGNYFTGNSRRLFNGSNHYLQYDLWQPDGSTLLLDSSRLQKTGLGAVELIEPRLRLQSQQLTPVAGTYRDTVRVIVSY
ncbi:spore coat protein U domain-containing protein [Rheinheimera texasensis]|uniref:spore coat protein U domain-containing protein n=1 Tax=Rheinheimera texasensis TaxID=306205 RepID=UPI0032B12FAA